MRPAGQPRNAIQAASGVSPASRAGPRPDRLDSGYFRAIRRHQYSKGSPGEEELNLAAGILCLLSAGSALADTPFPCSFDDFRIASPALVYLRSDKSDLRAFDFPATLSLTSAQTTPIEVIQHVSKLDPVTGQCRRVEEGEAKFSTKPTAGIVRPYGPGRDDEGNMTLVLTSKSRSIRPASGMAPSLNYSRACRVRSATFTSLAHNHPTSIT
jgi:hypothetical protein